MKRKNKVLYTLTMIIIIIVFLVIYLFGDNLGKIIYTDNLPKQPINNIRNVVKEEEQQEEYNNKNGNKKGNVKPNTDSPIKYIFNEDLTRGNYIYLTNQFPIKDEVGKKLSGEYKTFDFKLEFKKGSLGAHYAITLEKMADSDIDNQWVKVYLEKDGNALSETIRNTGRVKTFDNYSLYNDSNTNEIVLYQGVVNNSDIGAGYRNYTLRMWISEDVKVVNEKYDEQTIIAKVNVYAVGK